MSFTGLEYDMGAYRQTLRESTAVGGYMTAALAPASRVDHRHTDVESELLGLPRRNSECPADKFRPGAFDRSLAPPLPVDTIQARRGALFAEDTRVSNPPGNARGMGVNRFGYPLDQPQHHAIEPFSWPVSDTRNAKDNHRPCAVTPLDVSAVLPPPAPENVPLPDFVFSAVPTLPHVQVAMPPREFRYIM